MESIWLPHGFRRDLLPRRPNPGLRHFAPLQRLNILLRPEK